MEINNKIKPKEVLNSIWRISKLASPQFIFSIFASMILGLANFVFSYTQGFAISEAVRQASNNTMNLKIIVFLLLALLLILPIYFLGLISNISGGLYAENKLKRKLVLSMLNHKEEFIKDGHSGDLMSRFTSDTNAVDDFYFQGLNYRFIFPTVSGIASLITVWIVDYRLGLLAVIFGIISTIVSVQFSEKIKDANIKARGLVADSTRLLSEILANDEIIRLFSIEDRLVSDYHSRNDKYGSSVVVAEKYNHTVNSFNRTFSVLAQIAFLGLGAYLSSKNSFDFTKILILLPLQMSISNMFGNFGLAWNYLVEISTSADRLLEIIDSPWENKREEKDDLFLQDKSKTFISFKNINFSYNKDKPIFDNLSLDIDKNTTLALVGPSGSGKSTLFQLLLGFFEPDRGDILIDGLSFKDCNLNSWRKNMIYIQQEAPLFNKTIKENIALGYNHKDKNPSDKEIIGAAKLANIHDFILTLPDGYNTSVGEAASQISGGQRQRIVIARAFMSDAPILIMDEPTSALDSESEALVQESLNTLSKNKTVLVAAHRLSTIRAADSIVVLDKGRIIERGSHEELLDLKGYYYKYNEIQKEKR